MITSSLPDIFHKGNIHNQRAQKQGAPFSLYLNSYPTERHIPSRAGYAPGQHQYLSLNTNRNRSISSQSIKIKPILQKQNSKRSEQSKTKMKVAFKDIDLLEETVNKPKIGMSVMNYSNFPYENSRRSINNTIDMQQAENLKNKIQNSISQVSVLYKNLQQSNRLNDQTKNQLHWLNSSTLTFLQQLQSDFKNALTKCYVDLSTMRRDTNSQLKDNRQYLDKLKTQLNICSSYIQDLNHQSQNLYQECLNANAPFPRQSATPTSRLADFQEISSIAKTSRGATGDHSGRYKAVERQKKRQSLDLAFSTARNNRFLLNGKQIDLLNFEDEV